MKPRCPRSDKSRLGLAAVAGALICGPAAAGSVYDFAAVRIDGTPQALSDYHGQVLLIVNTASRCGFTRQYSGLQSLYDAYRDRGFVVLGFPSNDFGGQEPGSNEDIAEFCSLRFSVTFPLFEKIDVKGDGAHPLYHWLQSHPQGERVSWNFNKFLIGRDGRLIAHFGSRTGPESSSLIQAIEDALGESPP